MRAEILYFASEREEHYTTDTLGRKHVFQTNGKLNTKRTSAVWFRFSILFLFFLSNQASAQTVAHVGLWFVPPTETNGPIHLAAQRLAPARS